MRKTAPLNEVITCVRTVACGGTWMITPDTLRGKETVHFIGESKR